MNRFLPRVASSLGLALLLFGCPPEDGGDPAPQPGPVACGARAGDTCGDGEFCDYQIGQICGAADASAECAPIPQACYQLYSPVCGCDGVTYSNDCFANAAGTGVMNDGPCCGVGAYTPDAGEVPGGYAGSFNWEIEWSFGEDGTVTKTDLVSPCPAAVACVWSGIVVNRGTWSSSGSLILLEWGSADNTAGATTPQRLDVVSACGGTKPFALVETLGTGAEVTYSAD